MLWYLFVWLKTVRRHDRITAHRSHDLLNVYPRRQRENDKDISGKKQKESQPRKVRPPKWQKPKQTIQKLRLLQLFDTSTGFTASSKPQRRRAASRPGKQAYIKAALNVRPTLLQSFIKQRYYHRQRCPEQASPVFFGVWFIYSVPNSNCAVHHQHDHHQPTALAHQLWDTNMGKYGNISSASSTSTNHRQRASNSIRLYFIRSTNAQRKGNSLCWAMPSEYPAPAWIIRNFLKHRFLIRTRSDISFFTDRFFRSLLATAMLQRRASIYTTSKSL